MSRASKEEIREKEADKGIVDGICTHPEGREEILEGVHNLGGLWK
jgi:hypothetical protein